MRKHTFLMALLCLFYSCALAQAPDHVVISQVYSGGAVANSMFKSDFVELYNPTGSDVNLAGWSLQYAGGNIDNWNSNKVNLSGTIKAGRYFLVVLKSGSAGADLPAPDFTSADINMSTGAGKVALVNNTILLTGPCPTGAGIIDFVGYGTATTLNCNEGSGGAPALNTNTAAHRLNYGCTDNNDNKADFIEQAPNPRNSRSPGHTCGINISVGNIAPQLFCITATDGTSGSVSYTANTPLSGNLNVYLSNASGNFHNALLIGTAPASGNSGTININIPANLPSGESYSIRVDATNPQAYGQQSGPVEIIAGAKNVSGVFFSPEPTRLTVHWTNPPGCFEEIMIVGKQGASINGLPAGNGAAYNADLNFGGNGTAFDDGKVLYKGTQSGQTITGLSAGELYYIKIFTRRGTNWSTGTETSVRPRQLPNPGEVVINQFNPGYSAANANFEYIELVNNTANNIDLSELAIRYQSPTTGNQGVAGGQLSGVMPAHSYWLLTAYPADAPSETITIGLTKNLKRDGNISGGMGAASGQFALVRIADGLVLDAVRYGNVSAGTYAEGAPLNPISGYNGYKRVIDGADKNDNKADFALVQNAQIDLRNSKSRLANGGAVIASAADLSRLYVTGNAAVNGPVTLSEKLVLQQGTLTLGSYDLATKAVEGGNASSYVQTNGSGRLVQSVHAGEAFFPVGASTYNPLKLQNGSGLTWQVGVSDGVQAGNADAAVQRTWNVTPSQSPATGATISFYYDESDQGQLGPLFDKEEQLQVYQYQNNTWQKAGGPQEPGGTPGGMRTATLSNWTGFSQFVISSAGAQGALPIFFGDLRLLQQDGTIKLLFSVHNEEGVDHYEVESSPDGVTYERRALLMPRSNRGATVQYEFFENRPLAGDRFYRIRGVEQNGEVSFSAVVKARGKIKSPMLQIAPNPVVGGQLHYATENLAAGNYTLRIINSIGHTLHQSKLVHPGGMLAGKLVLPILKSGWYVLELSGPQPMKQIFLVQ